jgi:hypothetical protein
MPAGGEGDGTWLLPDVLVNVLRGGDDGPGVVREVLGVCVARRMVECIFFWLVTLLICTLTYRMDLAELPLGRRAMVTW